MRQAYVAALLILSLGLVGCAASEDENSKAEAIRQQLAQSTVEYEAEVTADIAGESDSFTLSCAETDEGPVVTVRAPELLSGVTARIGPDGELRFDGLVVPLRETEGVTALSALPKTLDILRTAHLDLIWREGDALIAQFLPEDDLALRAWFTPEGALSSAELIADGRTAVRLRVTKWNLKEKETENESDDSNLGGDQSQYPGAQLSGDLLPSAGGL